MIIGITGFLNAGKTEVAKILERDYGFKRLAFGDAVRAEARELGIPEDNREKLANLGDSRRQKFGGTYWMKKLIEQAIPGENYVFEGIRNPEEVDLLKASKDNYLIGVDAPIEVRFDRMVARGRAEDHKDFERFKIEDKNDQEGESGMGQQSRKCYNRADCLIYNSGTKEELVEKVKEIITNH